MKYHTVKNDGAELNYPLFKPKSLNEIPLPKVENGKIDAGIEDLVRALVGLRLPVEGSCEGHLMSMRPGASRYPWAVVWDLPWKTGASYQRLKPVIEDYNSKSKVEWTVDDSTRFALRPTRSAYTPVGMKVLRESANDLANHIFENEIKGNENYLELPLVQRCIIDDKAAVRVIDLSKSKVLRTELTGIARDHNL